MMLIPMQIKMKKNEVGRAWSAVPKEQRVVPFHQFPVAFVCRPGVHSMGKKLKYLAYIILTFSAKRENVKQYLTYQKYNCLIIKYALKVKFFNMRKYS